MGGKKKALVYTTNKDHQMLNGRKCRTPAGLRVKHRVIRYNN